MSGNNQALGTLLMAAAVIGTGGAALAALPAVGAAAAAGSATAAALVGASSTLATIGTIGAVGSSVFSGMQASEAAKFERAQIKQQMKQEEVNVAQQKLDTEQRLADTLATQRALFGARGVSLSSGTPVTAASSSISEANRQLANQTFGGELTQGSLRLQSGQKKLESRAAITRGITQGVSLLPRG